MPENLALNLGDAGLGGLGALVPMAMQRLSQGGGAPSGDEQAARPRRRGNGAAAATDDTPTA